jgi:CheY-like chemotaxis protein
LVDNHPIFREGLSMIIQSQPDLLLVGQAENAEDALSQFRRLRPDVTIMDQRLPGASGTDALIAIRKESPRAIVMMVTTSKQDMVVRRRGPFERSFFSGARTENSCDLALGLAGMSAHYTFPGRYGSTRKFQCFVIPF